MFAYAFIMFDEAFVSLATIVGSPQALNLGLRSVVTGNQALEK
jgi:hypothetical protein